MSKTINAIITFVLILFSFFAGVKYSESVKANASWLFESKEEVELPDLSEENSGEIGANVGEGAVVVSPEAQTLDSQVQPNPAEPVAAEGVAPAAPTSVKQ